MNKQYYTMVTRKRDDKDSAATGSTCEWLEIHTGSDRADVMHGKSKNRAFNVDRMNANTLAGHLLEFNIEIDLYKLQYVSPMIARG